MWQGKLKGTGSILFGAFLAMFSLMGGEWKCKRFILKRFLKGDSHQIQVFCVILQIVLAGCVVLFGRPADRNTPGVRARSAGRRVSPPTNRADAVAKTNRILASAKAIFHAAVSRVKLPVDSATNLTESYTNLTDS
jgi:hypothetical protein